jgi:ABC-type sugar transport system permease subunit
MAAPGSDERQAEKGNSMSEEEKSKQADSPEPGNRALRIVLGLVLMIPAGLCCIMGMVMPTLSTLNISLQKWNGLGSGEWVGMANYNRLFGDGVFSQAATFTIATIGVWLLAVAIVPLLLALGTSAFGRALRIPVRLAFTVPLALFTPVALALSWRLALSPRAGIVHEALLANPDTAKMTLFLIEGLFVLGLAAGLGLIAYLAALRGSGETPPTFTQVRRPLIVVWVVGLLATIALALQEFDWGYLLTQGGPINSTLSLAMYQYKATFMRFQLGFGAASAVPTLVAVVVLGVAAGLIVILTGLRLEHVPIAKAPLEGSKAIFGLLLALGLLCGVAGCLLNASAIPAGFSTGTGIPAGGGNPPMGRSFFLNTIVLQAVVVLVLQIPLTYLAALGIGGLRPLGKHSEWLLLLFSPWLFMTMGPIIVGLYQQARSSGTLNTLPGVAGPFLISVPALFILTLFFKGREKPYQEAVDGGQSPLAAFFSKVIGPSLPLALLLALAAILVGMQRFQWPLVVASDQDVWPIPLTLAMISGQYASSPAIVSQAIGVFVIPVFLFFLIAFGIYQVVYLDRLALCGPSSTSEPPQPAPTEAEPKKEETAAPETA